MIHKPLIVFATVLMVISQCSSEKAQESDSNADKNTSIEDKKAIPKNIPCSSFPTIGRFLLNEQSGCYTDLYGLSINCSSNKWVVDFFGPSPEEEHGMFYFKSKMKEFKLIDSLNFSIKLEKGSLFKDSLTFTNLQNFIESESAGFDNTIIELTGVILSKDSISIDCNSEYKYDCFGKGKIFRRFSE